MNPYSKLHPTEVANTLNEILTNDPNVSDIAKALAAANAHNVSYMTDLLDVSNIHVYKKS